MKTIGLEEHFLTTDLLEHLPQQATMPRDLQRRLIELDDHRLTAMDATGLDVQVLSVSTPGVQDLQPDAATHLQGATNDRIADVVREHPDRFQGFATLATSAPTRAARELERAITELGLNGAMVFPRTRDHSLDESRFWPIFEAASALNAPLYLHPQEPESAVRAAYYSGFGDAVDSAFARFGVGWHYDTGVQMLRLILAGVFDRFPDLQVILGHWGEMVLFYLDRIDNLSAAAKLDRPVSDYFRTNVHVTPGGVFSARYLRWALEVVGVERVMFATDYPYRYVADAGARRFLQEADLSDDDKISIASGNWDRLCAKIRR
ncbi:amidohydrolase family protein [Mycolicibacterium sphagni]|uniref:amidohydrolase family protein n=1 Tax=Mycolicibacterium sphagni TaxID=1786 RepID=UPI0021F34955|nr:amidohydrolase family protein [Mycolicibacterium sphagni]MCV7180203.1 amidohydrolase [Mycolicibacterium sphagni]